MLKIVRRKSIFVLVAISILLSGCMGKGKVLDNQQEKQAGALIATMPIMHNQHQALYIINEIEQRYPDKKVIVWLLDALALNTMTEEWLIAFNDRLVEDGEDYVLQLGRIATAPEYYQALKRHIVAGNQVDLIYTGHNFNQGSWDEITDSYMYAYQNDLLLPLEGHLSSKVGQKIYDQFHEKQWETVKLNGEIYGIPTNPYIGTQSLLSISKEVSQENELNIGHKEFDLHNLLALGIDNNLQNSIEFSWNLSDIVQFLGYEYVSLPIAMDYERGAFNIFTDQQFINYVETIRQFYNKGMIKPYGRVWDAPIKGPITGVEALVSQYNDEAIKNLGQLEVQTQKSVVGISKNALYPNESIALLSKLFTDKSLADLLVFGVEGEYYINEDGLIAPLDGKQLNQFLPVITGLAQFTTPTIHDIPNRHDVINQVNNLANLTPLVGFHVNRSLIEDELLRLNKEVAYILNDKKNLLNGHDEDYLKTLEKLSHELALAGIDEVIGVINEQYKVWKEVK